MGVIRLAEVSGRADCSVMVTQEDSWAREKEQTSPMFRLPKIIPLRPANPRAEVLLRAGLSGSQ
jgi:hypothetical protein